MIVADASITEGEPARRLRRERDRYVAFAFAASDLLIETKVDGKIINATGAAQALFGITTDCLVGRSILHFIISTDRPLARRRLQQVRANYRMDPVVVSVARGDGTATPALLGACYLPSHDDSVFLTLGLLPSQRPLADCDHDAATGLLSAESLAATAQRLVAEGSEPQQLKLVRLDGLSGTIGQLPEDQIHLLMQEVGGAIRAASVGGDVIGRLDDDTFGIMTSAARGSQGDSALAADLSRAIREAGIPDGRIESSIARIDLDLGGLSGKDAGHALAYAIDSLVKSLRGDVDIAQLQEGLRAAMKCAVNRMVDTRRMLDQRSLSLVYQPILNLATRTVHHFEALTRFSDGADTQATILFSEDAGLVAELDLIVCREVIKALECSDANVAVNLSGQSVQDGAFRNTLRDMIAQLGPNRPRLLFELTESAAVHDKPAATAFLSELRSAGHGICLDDFGAGAAAYDYLRHFNVDFVKIDGPFLKAAAHPGRERALIRSICVLCQELRCKVIGEMIEDEVAAKLAGELGIGFAQGWLFGKPLKELPPRIRSARRKGPTETWE